MLDILYGSRGSWIPGRVLCERALHGWPNTGLKSIICRLRKKIGSERFRIECRAGIGYRLVEVK